MATSVLRSRLLVVLLFIVTAVPALLWAGMAPDPAEAPPGLVLQVDATGTSLSLGGAPAFHTTPNPVVDERLIDVPDSSVRLITWQEVTPDAGLQPYYAISLDGQQIKTVRPTSYTLKLRHGEFDPGVAVGAVEPDLAANAGENLYIVQFVTQPLPQFGRAIASLGGTVYKFLPQHAELVKMDPATRAAVEALPFVRWVGPYHPAYRLEEYLRDNRAAANELFPSQRYYIMVFEAGMAQKDAVADRIEALGGKVDMRDAGKYLLSATLTPTQLYQAVRWDEVVFIDRWSPYTSDMDKVRIMGGADYLEDVAGFTGQGVRGEVIDVGFNLGHVDFASRPLIQHGTVGSDSHGASTSGIIFGDGTGDPTARGLLPSGQGIVADWYQFGTGTSRYTHDMELKQSPYFAVFQSASVGSSQVSQYTTESADMDALLFDMDIVHCQSQSNMGSTASRPQAWAKNIVSVGAVYHYNTLDLGDDCWCAGGSIGPATDGRIKPDLCFWYDEIHTCSSGSPTAYTDSFGGTSAATPCTAGHFGLFFQMWANGVFGNPVDPSGTVFDNRPHMTTAKAFMINTARQYPFTGLSHDKTRVHQGWGLSDVAYLWDMRNKIAFIDETEVLQNLETLEYRAYVGPDEPALKVTMTYADPPGIPSASQQRINDLSLRLTSPSGTVYWGNNGLMEGNWSTPGGTANEVDTVENVFVQNPEPGVWLCEIIATEVNEDSHVETPEVDADFALVVSGALHAPLSIEITGGAPDYMAPGQPLTLPIKINNGAETYVAGTSFLSYSYDGVNYTTQPLVELGGNQFEGTLPAPTCAATPSFYISASGDGGSMVYLPNDAPVETFQPVVATVTTLLQDNFETDLGWTVWNDPSLLSGAWQRAVPLTGTTHGEPQADFDRSGKCYVTDNRMGNYDVDEGPTQLISPVFDFSLGGDVIAKYAVWMKCDDLLPPAQDFLDIDVSSDGGATWVRAEHVPTQANWVYMTTHLTDYVPLSAQMQIRFSIMDQPNNSVTEAGVDAVTLYDVSCHDVGGGSGDLNCDGAVNAFDIDPFVLALTDPAGYVQAYPTCNLLNADINGDGIVNAFDIDPFVDLLTGP